ncbi:MAG: hypothetical protein HY231_04575 [Acidobacteria bacterium]|nr:hypothetical protein [Acidobacteriota bacterium]
MKIKTCLTILALLVLFFGGVITTRTFADSEDDAGELTGVIQSLPSGSLVGDWRVADHTIHVTSATRINQEHGQAAVGARVEVKGTAHLPSGGLVGDWQVGGRTIHVTSATRIDQEHGQATVGARVEVKGTAQSDGSITASTVEVKSSGSGDGSGMGGGSGSGGGMGGGSHDAGELTGVVQSLPSGGLVGDWQVADHTIHVTSATRIDQEHGQATVGARVEVKGTAQSDGSITASTVEVKGSSGGGSGDPMPMEFKGTIEGFPSGFVGDWQVGGRTIHVTATTRIEQELGPVAVGAFVEIKGTMQTDGSMTATSIEVKSNVAGGDGRDELKGTIESLPGGGLIGDWRVGGHTVHVTATTAINTEPCPAAVSSAIGRSADAPFTSPLPRA